MSALAVAGGRPVTADPWPQWPSFDEATVEAVAAAVRGGRWSLTGPYTGEPPLEREFAAAFARYVGVPYCVSTDHGSSALVLALQALGIGAGDEVVVPVLTWVATASAVLAVTAVPVLADVDPGTGCLSVESVLPALTDRTRAVLPVHLHCRMADVDGLRELTRSRGLALVEDCAQAHGARWSGALAGSFGEAAAFSMQQGKVLTCGEGGAVTTSDEQCFDRLQQLRADSRRYPAAEPQRGHPYLTDAGQVMGTNLCLGELQAALLLDQLARLDEQVERRAAAATVLDRRLNEIDGLCPLPRDPRLERPSVFEYAVRRHPDAFAGAPTAVLCQALEAELGVRVLQTDRPLHDNVLYCPENSPRFRPLARQARPAAGTRFPSAEALYDELILLPHRLLLAAPERMDEIVAAFAKVAAHAAEL